MGFLRWLLGDRRVPEPRLWQPPANTDPTRCGAAMRAPGAISCYWSCDLEPGHDGRHCCIMSNQRVHFSTNDMQAANNRRPSIQEMEDWEREHG